MILEYTFDESPADWFHITKCFPDEFARTLLKLYPEPKSLDSYSGKRDGANEFRTFVTEKTPVAHKIFAPWNTEYAKQMFTEISGVDCSRGHLRIELCQDVDGFWLERHIDIPEKLITLQIYLGDGDINWGTSIYFPRKGNIYRTVPFRHNEGWMTIAGSPLVHGVEQNMVDGLRKSVIINYVVGDWKDTDQLY